MIIPTTVFSVHYSIFSYLGLGVDGKWSYYGISDRQRWSIVWVRRQLRVTMILLPFKRWSEELTLIDWDRGKQYVLWTRDCRCFPRRSRGKHRQSRVRKTYCIPEVSVNKYFIIYWVSKEKKSTTNKLNMYKKDYLLPDMAPWGSVDLLFTGEIKVMSTA